MTRFARAKGSKSSNAREPEAATSWQEMKQDMVKKKQEKESSEEAVQHSVKLPNKAGKKTDKDVKWSEFPDMDPKPSKKVKTKSNKKVKEQERAVVDDEGTSKRKKKKVKDKSDGKASSKQDADGSSDIQETKVAESNKKASKKRSFQDTQSGMGEDDSTGIGNKVKRENKVTDSNKKASKKHSFQNTQSGMAEDNSTGSGNKTKRQKFNPVNSNTNKKQLQKKNKEYKRRKPYNEIEKIYINGIEIEITHFDGFPVKAADAERLHNLKKEMVSRGLPRSEINQAMKLERRRAEKALAREKKKVCFNCRQSGHALSECPQLKDGSSTQELGTGICFKCGSTEHTHFECKVQRGDTYKFAQCFICKEQGHIARQCPDNSRGLYPKGGACNVCGDVTHLKKDCPKYQAQQEEQKIMADTIDSHDIESLGSERVKTKKKSMQSNKIVKF